MGGGGVEMHVSECVPVLTLHDQASSHTSLYCTNHLGCTEF